MGSIPSAILPPPKKRSLIMELIELKMCKEEILSSPNTLSLYYLLASFSELLFIIDPLFAKEFEYIVLPFYSLSIREIFSPFSR
jgi:hypothetical protein